MKSLKEIIQGTVKELEKVERHYSSSTLPENHFYACGIVLVNTLVLEKLSMKENEKDVKQDITDSLYYAKTNVVSHTDNGLYRNQYYSGIGYAVKKIKNAVTEWEIQKVWSEKRRLYGEK